MQCTRSRATTNRLGIESRVTAWSRYCKHQGRWDHTSCSCMAGTPSRGCALACTLIYTPLYSAQLVIARSVQQACQGACKRYRTRGKAVRLHNVFGDHIIRRGGRRRQPSFPSRIHRRKHAAQRGASARARLQPSAQQLAARLCATHPSIQEVCKRKEACRIAASTLCACSCCTHPTGS